MKKKMLAAIVALTAMIFVGCAGNNNSNTTGNGTETTTEANATYKGFAVGKGFEAHKDVVCATAEVDAEGKLINLDINEYLGIRSIGRIINNITKANDEELAKVNAIADEDKVLSEDGKYADYKYVMIDGRYFECQDAGENLYVEIGEGASITNLLDYMWENPEWWYNAMQNSSNGAILKVAADGEEVVAEINGVKLAKMSDLLTYYGGLTKREGYTKNFAAAGTTTAWAESVDVLTDYIMNDGGVSDKLYEAANSEKTDEFLDTVSGATFGYPAMYVNAAKEAIENAKSSISK